MNPVRIVILEDSPIEMLTVRMMLEEPANSKYEYQVVGTFDTLELLLAFLETTSVDVILADIFNKNHPMGLELLKKKIATHIAVILMTSAQQKTVFYDAQQLRSVHYLIKPFHILTLHSTIDNVYEEFQKNKQYDFFPYKCLYIIGKSGQREQVLFEEIVYLESEGNYCYIFTGNKKYVLKKSLSQLLANKLDNRFIRIHQKYAVNTKYIKLMKSDALQLTGLLELPIGQRFQKSVREFLKKG